MAKSYSLQDLELLMRVVECRNMSEAGRQLNMTTAAVSAAIKRLEAALGVTLFERTTRSLGLSAAGEAFVPHVQEVLAALDIAEGELRARQQKLEGEIRIGLPSDLGRNLIVPLLDSFQVLHPQIRFVIHLSDYIQDLYREGLDMVIRYGEPQDSGLIAKKLADNHRLLLAAPSYIAARGALTQLSELKRHNCLLFYRNDRPYDHWAFDVGGKQQVVAVTGDRCTNDGELVKRWLLEGRGIAYKSRLDILKELAEGRVVELMPGDYRGQSAPLYAVYKERKYQAYRLTALLGYLQQMLG